VSLAGIFSSSAASQSFTCLPGDVKETEIVRVVRIAGKDGRQNVRKITARSTLKALKAKCLKGQLVDRKRRPIKFYRIDGCWGNPPMDYIEIQERQRMELAELKKKYMVIEISCDTGERPTQEIS
jgi:hypothetical protein